MRARSRWLLIALGVTALIGWPAGTSGADITADLNGRAIAPEHIADYYCHDLDFPKIHCFASERELDVAVAGRGIGPFAADGLLGVTYVHVFVNSSFGGASAYLANDYVNLGSIGWNDRISSFVALNSQSGRLYDDAYYGGSSYFFCCNISVAYVGDAFNDTFSSVRNTT